LRFLSRFFVFVLFFISTKECRAETKSGLGTSKKKRKTALFSPSVFLFLSLSFPPLSEVALLAALHADLGQRQADEEADVVCCFGF
jgi:hypothetical protein